MMINSPRDGLKLWTCFIINDYMIDDTRSTVIMLIIR